MEGPTTKRYFSKNRKSGEVHRVGCLGTRPENVCIFELPRLDFLQFHLFSFDFRSFSDYMGHLLEGGGGKSLQ